MLLIVPTILCPHFLSVIAEAQRLVGRLPQYVNALTTQRGSYRGSSSHLRTCLCWSSFILARHDAVVKTHETFSLWLLFLFKILFWIHRAAQPEDTFLATAVAEEWISFRNIGYFSFLCDIAAARINTSIVVKLR